jgi:hypothetical protein
MRAARISSVVYEAVLLFAALPATAQVVAQPACTNSTETVLAPLTNFFGGEGAGLAMGGGYLYVAENVNFSVDPPSPAFILQVSMDGTSQTQLPTPQPNGFGNLTAVALDASGNLYAADGDGYPNVFFAQPTANNVVWKWDGTTWSIFIPNPSDPNPSASFSNPTGLVFDANGNLYVALFGDGQSIPGTVLKYDANGNLQGTVWTAPDYMSSPYGMAFDPAGNLFIAGFGGGYASNGTKIFKIAAADVTNVTNAPPVVFADPILRDSSLTGGAPAAVAFDRTGNLYATYYNGLKILQFAQDGSFVEYPGGGIADDADNALAIDAQGDIFTVVTGGRTPNNTSPPALVKLTGIVSPSNSAAVAFSSFANPNGAWSYAYANTSGSTAFPTASTGGLQFPAGQAASPGLDFWTANLDSPAFDPDVFWNPSAFLLSTGCCDPVSPGGLVLQPSSVSGGAYNAVVQWNAPGDGNYFVAGQFSGLDFAGPTMTAASVSSNNGQILMNSTAVYGFGASSLVPFSVGLSVSGSGSSCSNVTFAVSPGSNSLSTALDAVAIPNNNNNGFFSPQSSVWFASQSVGSSASLQTVAFGDTGATVSNVSIVGENAGDFVVQSDQCTGTTVDASGCLASVTFHPAALGARSALLEVSTNDPNFPVSSIPIAGVGATNTSTAVVSSASSSSFDTSVTFTATVIPLGIAQTPTGDVQFYDGTTPLGTPVKVSSGQAQFAASSLTVGTHNIEAAFIPASTSSFLGVSANSLSQTVVQATPFITWGPAALTYPTPISAALNASADTAGTFSYSLGGTPLTGSEVLNPGTYTLSANFIPADTTNYASATQTAQVQVNKAAPTVTFTGAPANAAYQSTFTVTSSTNASTMPTIMGTGACSVGIVSGNAASALATVTMTSGTGTCNLTASWAADSNYSSATALQVTTAIKIAQNVTFTGALGNAAYLSTFMVTATTNATVTPTITGSGACSAGAVSGTPASASATITMTSGTGTCNLTASWVADNNYASPTPLTQTTTGTKINPTVTFTGAPAGAPNQATFAVKATTNASTIPAITGTAGVCSVGAVSGTPASATATVTMTSATGTCNLTASWATDNNYNSPSPLTQSTTATSSGVLSVSPTSLSFPGTPVGATSNSMSVALRNPTGASISFSVGFDGPFERSLNNPGNCTGTLGAGNHCSINVVFAPTDRGSASGSLTISGASGAPVALSGTGIEPTVTLALSSTQTGNFGMVIVGTNGAVATFTLSTNAPIHYVVGDLFGTGFNLPAGGGGPGTCASGPGLLTGSGPGTSCTIRVRFSPITAGPAVTSLTVTAQDTAALPNFLSVSPQYLSGTGIEPTVTLALSSTQTGNFLSPVVVGNNSAVATYTLSTNGPIGYSLDLSSTEFKRPAGNPGTCGSAGATLSGSGSGASCTIRIQFSPISVGAAQASLTVTARDTGQPFKIVTVSGSPQSLQGIGIQANAQLGNQTPWPITSARGCGSSTCGSGTVTLTNNGTAILTITSLTSTTPGTSPGYFVLSKNCGSTLAIGQQCSITVTFRPALNATPNAQQSSTLKVQYNSGSGSPTLIATSNLFGQESN